MQPVNVFDQSHHAIRYMLYNTAFCLWHTDFRIATQAKAALEQVEATINGIEEHMRLEEIQVFTAVFEYEPSIIDGFIRQHEASRELTGRIKARIEEVYRFTDVSSIAAVGSKLSMLFTELINCSLQQMAEEEEILNRVLRCYYPHKFLLALQQMIPPGLKTQDKPEVLKKAHPNTDTLKTALHRIYPL